MYSKPILIFSVFQMNRDVSINENVHQYILAELTELGIPTKELWQSVEGQRMKSILVEGSEFARETVEDICETQEHETYIYSDEHRQSKLVNFAESEEVSLGELIQVDQDPALSATNWLLDPITGQYWTTLEIAKPNRVIRYG